jgi:hypothetical protein
MIMYIKLSNPVFALMTDTYQQWHRILLVADPPFPGGVVKSFKSKEEAEYAVQNFIDRYEVASKHGYEIAKLGNGEVLFVKSTGHNQWNTATAIDLDESLEDFEESLNKDDRNEAN